MTRSQFHQCFTRTFFVQNFGAKNYKAAQRFHTKFWRQKHAFVRKTCATNVDEIDLWAILTFFIYAGDATDSFS